MRRAAAVLAGCLPLAAAAETPTAAECGAVWEALRPALPAAASLRGDAGPTAEDGGCTVRGVVLDGYAPYAPVYSIDRLAWSGEGIVAAAAGGPPPRALRLTVGGLRFGVATGDPLMDWLMREQRARYSIGAGLSAVWDEPGRALLLEEFSADFPGDNAIAMTARIDRVDLSTAGAAQTSLGTAALTRLDLSITTHGLFEDILLLPLGNVLLSGSADPEADLAALVAEARGMVAALPEATFPEPSKAALSALLDDMPHPAGTVRIAVAAPDGFGAARFAGYALTGTPSGIEDLAPLFQGVTVDIAYDRSAAAGE